MEKDFPPLASASAQKKLQSTPRPTPCSRHPHAVKRQPALGKRKAQPVPFRRSDGFGRLLFELLAKLKRVKKFRGIFRRPVLAGEGAEGWPEFFAEPPAGFGREKFHQVEPFAKQHVSLKFHVSGNQLQPRGQIGFAQMNLPRGGFGIGSERVAQFSIAQQAGERGDEISFRHGCAGVWRLRFPARPRRGNLRRVRG